MAVTHVRKGGGPSPARSKALGSRLLENSRPYTLPTEKTKPITHLGQAKCLFYGERKIGKTLVSGEFPDAFFFHFEPGAAGAEIFSERIPDWKFFVKVLDTVLKSDRFKTLVIDTVDVAVKRCQKYVCEDLKIDHPNDMPYGKGWDALSTEFQEQMIRVVESGRGSIFISHAVVRDFHSRTSGVVSKIVPSIPTERAFGWVTGTCDLNIYFGYYGDERLMTVQGSEDLEAGGRLQEKYFLTPSGERVVSIPMGKGPVAAYKNLCDAFANKQKDTGESEYATSLEKRAKPIRGKER